MANRRILVVEDEPDGQEMIATILRHLQYTVDTADDGQEAAERLFEEDNSYGAVVTDLALPHKDGWELLHEIRTDPRTANLPCIAVTAFHTSKLREEALHAGFTAYFPKPLDGILLAQELDRILG